MTAADEHAIATWRYPGEYSSYDADADLEIWQSHGWCRAISTTTFAGYVLAGVAGEGACTVGAGLVRMSSASGTPRSV